MAMWQLIIKNNSGSAKTISDLGITIADSTQNELSENFTFHRLAGSDDLRALVLAGDLVVNDGSSDLSAANGVAHLTLEHKKNVADNHYTKTELSTGTASVHWDSITNAPAFGDPAWIEPVKYRVVAIQSAEPGSPSEGDVYIDTDDDHYYKYISSSWVDQGAAADGERVIKLDEADEAIFERVSGTWTDQGAPNDNDAVTVSDDGDGKQAQYVYNTDTWIKFADVDFGDHTDGGASKHDASEIDVEGTYTYVTTGDLETAIGDIDDELDTLHTSIDGHLDGTANKHDASEIDVEGTYTNITTGDLETAIGDIDTELSNALGMDLDDAYDNGATINADAGPVVISASGGYSPLQLTQLASAPNNGLAAGQVCVVGGIMYIYDGTRTKWLSAQRQTFVFGHNGKAQDQDLSFFVSEVASNLSGLRIMRNATITGISGQLDASGTATFHIRKNDVVTNILSLTVTADTGNQAIDSNVDLSQGDFLQAYLASAAKVDYPITVIEVAWRI